MGTLFYIVKYEFIIIKCVRFILDCYRLVSRLLSQEYKVHKRNTEHIDCLKHIPTNYFLSIHY